MVDVPAVLREFLFRRCRMPRVVVDRAPWLRYAVEGVVLSSCKGVLPGDAAIVGIVWSCVTVGGTGAGVCSVVLRLPFVTGATLWCALVMATVPAGVAESVVAAVVSSAFLRRLRLRRWRRPR